MTINAAFKIEEGIWAAGAPTWGETQSSSEPIFTRAEIKPMLGLALARAVAHAVTAFRLISAVGLKGMLGFMTWLETARFFGVRHLRSMDGRRLPVTDC